MKEGDKVQDFILKNTEGNEVTFSEELNRNENKALILFIPLAFSTVCTREVCSVRDNIKLFKSLNAIILGISVDSLFTLREFKKTNNLPFILLSDFNKEVSDQFGVLNRDYYGMKGVSRRASFVVNRDMIIEYAEVLVDSGSLPDFKAIYKSLEK